MADRGPKITAAPLLELAGRRGRVSKFENKEDSADEHVWRTLNRAMHEGRLGFYTADRICTYFDTHMSLVYGDLYWSVAL